MKISKLKATAVSIVLSLSMILTGITFSPLTASADMTVYVTKSGTKYHFSSNCKGLNHASSISSTSLSSAKSHGLQPCSICSNDASSVSFEDKISLNVGESSVPYGSTITVSLSGENQNLYGRTDVSDGTVCYIPHTAKINDIYDKTLITVNWDTMDFSPKQISLSELSAGTYYINGYVEKCVYSSTIGWYVASEQWATKSLSISKADQNFTVYAPTQKVKFSKLKNKKQTITAAKAFKVENAVGSVSYKLTKKDKKAKNNIAVSKSGKITIKKGLKKGTYKIKVTVTAAGDMNYNSKSIITDVKIKVK